MSGEGGEAEGGKGPRGVGGPGLLPSSPSSLVPMQEKVLATPPHSEPPERRTTDDILEPVNIMSPTHHKIADTGNEETHGPQDGGEDKECWHQQPEGQVHGEGRREGGEERVSLG